MKRLIPFVAAVLVALSAQAQTVNVHMTNGTTQKYGASKVDHIDFSGAGVAPEGLKEVDLGLPSGIKWANMNVGATNYKEYGTYFSWGETETKTDYTWPTYQWGSWNDEIKRVSITKYNSVLNPEDDAATINWGPRWRMPTKKEFEELIANTTAQFETLNNDSVVVKLTSKKNGKFIYLPLAGWWNGRHITWERQFGYYWTSTLGENPQDAYTACFTIEDYEDQDPISVISEGFRRPIGKPVRPVVADDDAGSSAPEGVEEVDLGLSVKWANMNVGAESFDEWGNFYAWGEAWTRHTYGWYYGFFTGETNENGYDISLRIGPNYKWGAYDTGMTGYTGLTTLEADDDPATANWGNGWRTPTKAEFEELLANTNYEVGESDGVAYAKFTSKINGKSIYLPAGGYYDGESNNKIKKVGRYYSSTVNTDDCTKAYFMGIDKDNRGTASSIRTYGYNIRPVKK
jgi:hypothetical protein